MIFVIAVVGFVGAWALVDKDFPGDEEILEK